MAYSKELQHLIDIFKPPPPKWESQPVPDFWKKKHPEKEEDAYWEEENRRWLEGHYNERGEYIDPMLYYCIQNANLNNIDGDNFNPNWRDTDELMSSWCMEAMRDEESLLVYKRREVGATAFFGNVPFYFMRVNPGCSIGLTGKDQRNITGMFNNKILQSFNRFNPKVLNTTPVQYNNSINKVNLSIALKVLKNGVVDTRVSKLFAAETSEKPDSPSNLSGERFKYVYVDEAPLHKRIDAFLSSIFPTLNQGAKRTGLLVMAGTIEPTLTSNQVAEFYELIQRSKNLRVRTEMLPVYMGLFEKNGYSNKEAGLYWYHEERKRYEDANDKIGLRNFVMQYPKDEADIFEFSQGGMLEEDTADALVVQLNKLQENGCPEAPYKLVPNGSDIVALPDDKLRKKDDNGNYVDGGFWLIEHPKKVMDYYMAIDGVGTGKEDGDEKGSWMASIVFKGIDPQGGSYAPVGFYYERPKTVEAGYMYTVNMFKFFNKFGGFKDINFETAVGTSSHFGTYLQKEGLFKYAMSRKDLSGKGWVNTDKKGTAVNDKILDWQLRQANIFLRKYAGNFQSIMILKDLLKAKEINADLRSAFFNFMSSIPDFDKPALKPKPPAFKTRTYLVTTPDGSTRWKTEKYQVLTSQEKQVSMNEFELYDKELKDKYGRNAYHKASEPEKQKWHNLKLGFDY